MADCGRAREEPEGRMKLLLRPLARDKAAVRIYGAKAIR